MTDPNALAAEDHLEVLRHCRDIQFVRQVTVVCPTRTKPLSKAERVGVDMIAFTTLPESYSPPSGGKGFTRRFFYVRKDDFESNFERDGLGPADAVVPSSVAAGVAAVPYKGSDHERVQRVKAMFRNAANSGRSAANLLDYLAGRAPGDYTLAEIQEEVAKYDAAHPKK